MISPVAQPVSTRAKLMIGVALLAVSLPGHAWAQESAEPAAIKPAPAEPIAVPPETQKKVEVLRQATFVLVVLVIVLAVSLLAFRRWSRHFRNQVFRTPQPRTVVEDVWSMHRVPEIETLEEDDSPDEGADEIGDDR